MTAIDQAKKAWDEEDRPRRQREAVEQKRRAEQEKERELRQAAIDQKRLEESGILRWFPGSQWLVKRRSSMWDSTTYIEADDGYPMLLTVRQHVDPSVLVVMFTPTYRTHHSDRHIEIWQGPVEIWEGPVVKSAADVGRELAKYKEDTAIPSYLKHLP